MYRSVHCLVSLGFCYAELVSGEVMAGSEILRGVFLFVLFCVSDQFCTYIYIIYYSIKLEVISLRVYIYILYMCVVNLFDLPPAVLVK